MKQFQFLDTNPDTAFQNSIENHMSDLHDQILALECQLNSLERAHDVFVTNHFVVSPLGESFADHMAEVTYPNGYYESIEIAMASGRAEYGVAFTIFNLRGSTIAVVE